MQNAEVIGNEITQKDQNALKALTKIEFSSSTNEENDQGTWNFRFHFSENDCFTNDVLTKSVIYSLEENRPIRNVGCEINWKEGKNLTKKTVQKKQKNKKSGQQRTVSKEVDDESFFNFFKTIDEIDEEALNNEDANCFSTATIYRHQHNRTYPFMAPPICLICFSSVLGAVADSTYAGNVTALAYEHQPLTSVFKSTEEPVAPSYFGESCLQDFRLLISFLLGLATTHCAELVRHSGSHRFGHLASQGGGDRPKFEIYPYCM